MFYTGDRFPGWKRNAFVGGMREGEVAPSGHLQRIVFNDKWEEHRRESLLRDLHQRIRDVRQGPDGLLYLLTDEDQAALVRIEPVAPASSADAARRDERTLFLPAELRVQAVDARVHLSCPAPATPPRLARTSASTTTSRC